MSEALSNLVKNRAAKRRSTPQTEPTPGRNDEVVNSAGGYVFKTDDKNRLERLLILGTATNTYYVDAKSQAENAFDFIKEVIAKDEDMVRNTVVDVSVNGRALRQNETLMALAMLLQYGENKAATREIFNDVVRTATHLYTVCQYIDDLGGWGSAKTKAVASFFVSRKPEALAYQAVKYRSRSV